MPKKSINKCLAPDCDRAQFGRGLCRSCYQSAAALVREKRTTWEKLEKEGKTSPRKKKNVTGTRSWLLNKTKP